MFTYNKKKDLLETPEMEILIANPKSFCQFLNPKEAETLIRKFFADAGLFLNRQQRVAIVCKPEERLVIQIGEQRADVLGEATTAPQNGFVVGVIRLYKDAFANRSTFVETLFHELDHVLWAFEGKDFNESLPYEKRPHEIRARFSEQLWAARICP